MYRESTAWHSALCVRGEILVAVTTVAKMVSSAACMRGKAWARVVHIRGRKGYGNALRAGIQAASGKWIHHGRRR